MERVLLGRSDLEVSRFCFGAWNFSSRMHGWGPEDERHAETLVNHALDTGCNFIDTARGYGDSEEILGRILKDRRDGVVLATKFVQCPPAEIAGSIEASLENLQTDCLDLSICHWPRPSLPLEPFFEEMTKQKASGKIREIGVSNFNLEQMTIAEKYGVVSLQPPFSIVWRFPEEILQFCREKNIAVTPYSPLAQGLLTGRYSRGHEAPTGIRSKNRLFSERLFPEALKVAKLVDGIADELGCESSQVALAWALQTPGITSPIVGCSRTEQWDANVAALDMTLPEDVYRQLDHAGLNVWSMVGPEDPMWGWKPT